MGTKKEITPFVLSKSDDVGEKGAKDPNLRKQKYQWEIIQINNLKEMGLVRIFPAERVHGA